MGGAPHCLSPSTGQHPPLRLNVGLASPALHSTGPYSGGSCQDAPHSRLPSGPLPAVHSQPHSPAPVRLPPTHSARTHPESTPLPKVGECRAWDSRDRELWSLERTVKEISFVGFVSPKAPSHRTGMFSSPIACLEGRVPPRTSQPPSQGCSLLCCEWGSWSWTPSPCDPGSWRALACLCVNPP